MLRGGDFDQEDRIGRGNPNALVQARPRSNVAVEIPHRRYRKPFPRAKCMRASVGIVAIRHPSDRRAGSPLPSKDVLQTRQCQFSGLEWDPYPTQWLARSNDGRR